MLDTAVSLFNHFFPFVLLTGLIDASSSMQVVCLLLISIACINGHFGKIVSVSLFVINCWKVIASIQIIIHLLLICIELISIRVVLIIKAAK